MYFIKLLEIIVTVNVNFVYTGCLVKMFCDHLYVVFKRCFKRNCFISQGNV